MFSDNDTRSKLISVSAVFACLLNPRCASSTRLLDLITPSRLPTTISSAVLYGRIEAVRAFILPNRVL
jgi:hypothetical protein